MNLKKVDSVTDCCSSACQKPSVSQPAAPANAFWLNWALVLVALTVLYNLLEAGVAVYTGWKSDSVALEGFGLDSLIEVSAAILMLWRLILQRQGSDEAIVETSEVQVHRFVGVSFLLLSVYIAFESGTVLLTGVRPAESLVGLVLAGLSIVVMPILAWGKLKVADQIKSGALKAEAKETIACGVLSLILLIGLGLNVGFGWWWADPVAGLTMLPWLIREGLAGIRGEGCCG